MTDPFRSHSPCFRSGIFDVDSGYKDASCNRFLGIWLLNPFGGFSMDHKAEIMAVRIRNSKGYPDNPYKASRTLLEELLHLGSLRSVLLFSRSFGGICGLAFFLPYSSLPRVW